MRILAEEEGLFGRITVFETTELYGELGKFRCMRFEDEAVQGALDLRKPERIVLGYQKAVVGLMDSFAPSFASAYIIGHGIGTIGSRYRDRRIMTAEIDEKVAELSRRFFGCRTDHVSLGDGRALLKREAAGSLDVILLDAFTRQGTPAHLTTLEFFRLSRDKLRSDGVLLLNLFGRSIGDRHIEAIHTTLREAYPHTRSFFLPLPEEPRSGNVFLLGSGRPLDGAEVSSLGLSPGVIETVLLPGHVIHDRNP